MSEWISVEDRLPEEGIQVLIYTWRKFRGYVEIVSPRRAMYSRDGHWTAISSWDFEPTHWMPLPTPPEANDES